MHLRIKILFNLHDVMKKVGGVKQSILVMPTILITSRWLKNKISIFIFTLNISHGQISSSGNEDSCKSLLCK